MRLGTHISTTTTTPHGVIKRFFFLSYYILKRLLLSSSRKPVIVHCTIPCLSWVSFWYLPLSLKKIVNEEWMEVGNLMVKSWFVSKAKILLLFIHFFQQYFSISSLVCNNNTTSFVEKGKMCADYFPPHQPSNITTHYPLLCSIYYSSYMTHSENEEHAKVIKSVWNISPFSSWIIKTHIFLHATKVYHTTKI